VEAFVSLIDEESLATGGDPLDRLANVG
jgi:hypothetical protein